MAIAQHKFPYVEKWLANERINQKLSNQLWKNKKVTDVQITQTLKFRYAQYMGNHTKKHLLAPKIPKPQLYIMPQK